VSSERRQRLASQVDPPRVKPIKSAALLMGWALVVLVFASQWYAYDASRNTASRFRFYLGWSLYLWALVTPSAIWMAHRFRITPTRWMRGLLLHLTASIAITATELLLEAYLGWLRHGEGLTVAGSLRHYFAQHAQIGLVTYWLVVTAVLIHDAREHARATAVRSARLETQLTSARLELLRRQFHPHFLFNTLQAATTLVHEDADRAEEVLVRLSDLLRISIYESKADEIPLGRELAIMEHYLGIQVCRFQDRLQFDVGVEPELMDCLVPALLLQPLVENAVKHGVEEHRGNDTVTIRANRAGNRLRLIVCNSNGSLRQSTRTDGHGYGVASTTERLEQLYGSEQSSFQLYATSPTGVCADVTLPFRFASDAALPTKEPADEHPRAYR
jgi:two-component system, LytTR family, sensor kinase